MTLRSEPGLGNQSDRYRKSSTDSNSTITPPASPIRDHTERDYVASVDIATGPAEVAKQIQNSRFKNNIITSLTPTLQDFLIELQLQKYIALFLKEGIDFLKLQNMDEEDMKNIGLNVFGPRRKIKNAIKVWQEHQEILEEVTGKAVASLLYPLTWTLLPKSLLCYDGNTQANATTAFLYFLTY